MSRNKNIVIILVASIVLFAFFSFTNPNQISLGLLALPIMLVALITYFSARLLMNLLHIFNSGERTQKTLAITASVFLTGLLIFQSIGGLTYGDVILLVVFGGVSIFYLSRLL